MLAPSVIAHDAAAELFARHAAVFGADLQAYSGHVHRVIDLVRLQLDVPDTTATLLGAAAFFHDAGIWFANSWDYLPPSVALAAAAVAPHEDPDGLVAAMIGEHHRIHRAHHPDRVVEAFRRADLADISCGLLTPPGLTMSSYRELVARYPVQGFRLMLLRAFSRGLRADPRHPAPMIKW